MNYTLKPCITGTSGQIVFHKINVKNGMSPSQWLIMLNVIEIQERFCNVGGLRIHYLERESNNDPNTVVCLHSFSSGAFLWREWMSSIKFNGRIVAPDLPGNGSSSLPLEEPGLNYHVRFLNEFLQAINVQQFIGVGCSMGSNILAAFALDSPEKLKHLILTSPVDDTATLNPFWKIAAQPGIGEMITKIFPVSKKALHRQLSKNFFRSELLTSELISEWWDSFQTGHVRRWIPKALRAPKTVIHWQGIYTPSILVFGKNDPVVSSKFRARLQSSMKMAKYHEFNECGHYPHLEYPEKLEELILAI